MSADEVTQIRVGRHATGIIGLKAALAEVAEQMKGCPDEQIAEALMGALSPRNYIPSSLRQTYAQAFLREYKKRAGEPYTEETGGALEIKVLGAGCNRCEQLTRDLMAVMAETGIVADLEHITDMKRIAAYGVMGSPALLIKGKVVSVGTVPPKSQLKTWLVAAKT
jgi:small redox-active disulfide protein 2